MPIYQYKRPDCEHERDESRERVMQKPHIFWSKFDRKWACVLPYVGIVESGNSPKEAYDRYRREALVKEIAAKLLDRRSHAVLKRFDSYAPGNNSTIQEW